MDINLNIEKFKNNSHTNLNTEQKKATQAVDHCRLRDLSEIKSEMCEPSVKTSQACVVPAVTKAPKTEKECVLYRYDSPENIMNNLSYKGFYLFRNMISNEIDDSLSKIIKNDMVDYNKLKNNFINSVLIDNLNKELDKKLLYTKFRVSDTEFLNNINQNITSYHRDLHSYSEYSQNKDQDTSVYTIIYLTKGGYVDIIPKTNKYSTMTLREAYNFINKSQVINLDKNDLILVDAKTIHKINFNKTNNNQLIQLFDCVFEPDLKYYVDKTLHIPCYSNCNQKNNINFFNQNKYVKQLIDMCIYFNTALGYSKLGSKYFSNENIQYISSEYNYERLNILSNTFQKNNVYILNLDGIKDMAKEDVKMFKFISHYLNLIVGLCILILLIIIFIFCIRSLL